MTAHRNDSAILSARTTSSQYAAMGQLAHAWLLIRAAALESMPVDEVRVRAELQTLTGLWLCHHGLRGSSGGLIPMAARVRELLDQRIGMDRRALLHSCDAALLLVSTGILEALDMPSQVAWAWAHDLARTLDLLDEPDTAEAPGCALTSLLLGQLDVIDSGPEGRAVPWLPVPDAALITADDSRIDEVLRSLEAAAMLGLELPSAEQREWGLILSIWLVELCRRYHLPRVAAALRIMHLLEFDHLRCFQAATSFLVSQQQPDGRFGYHGAEVVKLAAAVPGFDQDLQLYLPTTLACLHTLTELAGAPFRLYRSLGRAA